MSPGRSSVGAKRRRLAFEARTLATLMGRGWALDLGEDGVWTVRKVTERESIGTVETYYSTVWFRKPREQRLAALDD